MSLSHPEFSDDHTPLAFFITFRTYGTWLHGDRRGSIDRFHNRYGTPRLPPNRGRKEYEQRLLKQPPVRLKRTQRAVVMESIKKPAKSERCTYSMNRASNLPVGQHKMELSVARVV